MSPSASICHMPIAMANSLSLAILPSTPMVHTSSHHQHPATSKRPKLSLNTANVPSIFGKKSTSLRLDTLSTTSPTSRNTFRNATLEPHRHVHEQPQQPSCWTTSSPTGSSSASTTQSSSGTPCSRLSHHNVKPILRNGPIARRLPPRTSSGQPKPAMFPAAKRVAFRTPLEEVVTTTKYTMRHVDIESSTSTISTLELSPAKAQEGEEKEEAIETCDSATKEDQKPSKSELVGTVKQQLSTEPQTGDKRESSDEEEDDDDHDDDDDNDDSDTPALTPIAGRRKRSRRWVWTLPHVHSAMEHTGEAATRKPVDGTASA